MQSKNELLQAIEKYIVEYSSEEQRIQPILSFVSQFDGADLYRRSNFTGHITASAFVANPVTECVLLIEHSTLKRWLQPGGHVELHDENLLSAAMREVKEETNIDTIVLKAHDKIFDIDSHAIPANPRKEEPAHTHHDIRFLFTCESTLELTTPLSEVNDCQWVSINKLAEDESFAVVVGKLRQLFY